MSVFFKGLLLVGSLIVSIGAQNIFILKQGLKKEFVFLIATICLICDLGLFAIAIYGIGSAFSDASFLNLFLPILGGLFLMIYGFRCAKSAYLGQSYLTVQNENQRTPKLKIITTTLAVTLLNPHVYLDAFVIIGGYARQFQPDERLYFLLGSTSASLIWFYGLAFGASLLIPLFKKERTWQILEAITALIMWYIAYGLFAYFFTQLKG